MLSGRFALQEVAPLEPEFIVFTTVDSYIDAENLGGPGFVGVYRSIDTAQIELRSNTRIRVVYDNGGDMKNDESTLPTQWETAVLGAGALNGHTFKSPTQYTDFVPTDDGRDSQPGTIIDFDAVADAPSPSPQKAFQTRLAVIRNGLQDRAGTYSSSVTVSYFKW